MGWGMRRLASVPPQHIKRREKRLFKPNDSINWLTNKNVVLVVMKINNILKNTNLWYEKSMKNKCMINLFISIRKYKTNSLKWKMNVLQNYKILKLFLRTSYNKEKLKFKLLNYKKIVVINSKNIYRT